MVGLATATAACLLLLSATAQHASASPLPGALAAAQESAFSSFPFCRDAFSNLKASPRPRIIQHWTKAALSEAALSETETFLDKYGHIYHPWQLGPHPNITLREALLLVNASSAGPVGYYSGRESDDPTILTLFHMARLEDSELLRGLMDDIGGGPPAVSHIIKGGGSSAVFTGQSVGGGLTMHQHGEAWIGQVGGRKLWFLQPPDDFYPLSTDPNSEYGSCSYIDVVKDNEDARRRTIACVQSEGEVLWLPELWWHGTCALDAWTIGVGAQRSAGSGSNSDPDPRYKDDADL
jgi:hypothetical protein